MASIMASFIYLWAFLLLLTRRDGRASVNAREIRLVNGRGSCSGRVEVYHNRQWGTVCGDLWDLKDATVVCRQMGCGTARKAPGSARFGRGTGRIWRDDVQCRGAESALSQCPARPWGQHNCHHGKDAGVVCSGAAHEIRLVNGRDSCSGRVEVYHNRQWGTVCDDRWGLKDATVVCRQMGCGTARQAPGSARFGRGTGPIWRDDVQCTGAESALSQCSARSWGQNNCNHGEDAGVICSGNKVTTTTTTAAATTRSPMGLPPAGNEVTPTNTTTSSPTGLLLGRDQNPSIEEEAKPHPALPNPKLD